MHETSIALSILATVEDVFKNVPDAKKVKSILIRVGLLSLVDIEALRFALRVASRGTPAEGADISILLEYPLFRCRVCGREWSLDKRALSEITGRYDIGSVMHLYPDVILEYLKCPYCGSTDIEIVKGRGVILDSVEIE